MGACLLGCSRILSHLTRRGFTASLASAVASVHTAQKSWLTEGIFRKHSVTGIRAAFLLHSR